MGARAAFMLTSNSAESDPLLAPAHLQLFVTERGQRLGHVLEISALRPGHHKGPGGQRKGFVDAEAASVVLGPHLEVGVDEDSSRLFCLSCVGPVLWGGGPQMATVLPQVEARLSLDKILNV